MRAVVRVPRLPPLFLGGRPWRGCVWVLPLEGCAAPPLWFFLSYFFVSVAGCPALRSRGLCPPIPSLPGHIVWCLCVFGFLRGVCPRVLGVLSVGWLLPSAWCCRFWLGGPPAPLWRVLSSVPSGWGVWPPLVVLVGSVVAVGRSRAPPPLLFFFSWGGVCLFLSLPSLAWHMHWSAFCSVFRFAVGGCVVPGRAPAPWVGWVMHTLSSAPLPAGLGSGSAGWAVVPGGFVWPWVSRVPSSLRCRLYLYGGGLCWWTATFVAGLALALCRRVAGWWGSFREVRWFDVVGPSVSVPCLVLWCVVVRRAASCPVWTCCVVLVRAVLRCALLGRTVLRRVAPWCAALCRVASRRAVACCALGCLVVLRCTLVRCGAVCVLPRVVPWWVGRGQAGPCRGAECGSERGWLVVWGVRSGGWLAGSVLQGSGCDAGADGSGRCPWGCPPWGPVPWSRVLWGSRSLALGTVAVPSSSSGACEVALVLAGVVA